MSEEAKNPATPMPLPVGFVEKLPEEVAVIDKKKEKAAEKKAERQAIARLHQQFNGAVMRVRIRKQGEAAAMMEKVGLRKVGYGLYYAGGYNADEIIARIEEQIEKLQAQGVPASDELAVELRKVQVQLNAQIIQLGDSHIEATKEAAPKNAAPVHMVFPAGQPVVVATGKATDIGVGNGTEKHLTNGGAGT